MAQIRKLCVCLHVCGMYVYDLFMWITHIKQLHTKYDELHSMKLHLLFLKIKSQERCAVTEMSQDQGYQTSNNSWRTSARLGCRVECQETGNLSWKRVLSHAVCPELKPKQKAEVSRQLLAERNVIEESRGQSSSEVNMK